MTSKPKRKHKLFIAILIFIILILVSLISPGVIAYLNCSRIAEQISKAIDSNDPYTRDFAIYFAKQHAGDFNFNQVCDIYDFVRNNWKYVNDPKGFDCFTPASHTIGRELAGDCDDFAIVIAATLMAIGADARVVCAHGEKSAHAYAEVNLGKDPDKNLDIIKWHYGFLFFPLNEVINYKTDEEGNWLNLDWLANRPGGPYEPADWLLIVYPDGKFKKEVL